MKKKALTFAEKIKLIKNEKRIIINCYFIGLLHCRC